MVVVTGHSDSYSTEVKEFYQMNGDGELQERGFGVEELTQKTKDWFSRNSGKLYKHYTKEGV